MMMMKRFTYISLALLPLAAATIGEVAPTAVKQKQLLTTKSYEVSTMTQSKLLGLRGGGGVFGTPVTTEVLRNLFIAGQAVQATTMLLSPNDSATMYGTDPKASFGPLDTLMIQTMGGSAANAAITAYLATCIGTLSAAKTIAYAVIPCSAIMVNGFLCGSFLKAGFLKGSATALSAIFLACQYLIFSGNEQATLAAQILAAVHTTVGVIGFLAPEAAAKLNGVDLKGDAKKIHTWQYCYSLPLLTVAAMHILLLRGETGLTALAGGALVQMASGLAAMILGKGSKLFNVPENVYIGIAAFYGIIALGILYG